MVGNRHDFQRLINTRKMTRNQWAPLRRRERRFLNEDSLIVTTCQCARDQNFRQYRTKDIRVGPNDAVYLMLNAVLVWFQRGKE